MKTLKPLEKMNKFSIPFSEGLSADNNWIKTAKLIPWDFVED